MIKKLLARLLVVPMLALGLLIAPAANTNAVQNCGASVPALWAYSDVGRIGLLGSDCETVRPSGDPWWGGLTYPFREKDDNNLESIKFRGSNSNTVCLFLYDHYNYNDQYIVYRLHNTSGTYSYDLPSSWRNVVSSHMIKFVAFSAPCQE